MLFLIIGVIYERRHTREISEYGGLAHVMPKYAIVFAIAMLSSAGLPLLNGFIGEFTILQGAFEVNHWWVVFSVTGVILGAAYLLWLYQRTMLGQITNGKNLHLPDLSARELAVFLPLIAWAIWIGVYPKPYFDVLEKPVAQIVERVRPGYFQAQAANHHSHDPGGGKMSQFYTSLDNYALLPATLLGAVRLRRAAVRVPGLRRTQPAANCARLIVVVAEIFVGIALYKQQAFIYGSTASPVSRASAARSPSMDSRCSSTGSWWSRRLIVAIVSYKYLEISGEHHTEYYGLMLFAQCGMFFLVAGTDLVTLFIGLELMALCFYIMVGFLRTEKRSNEAAIKYLLLGAFSSGFLAYGFSVMYGISGSTRLVDIASAIAQRPATDPIVFLAMATTAVGLLFKVSAVPFHMWAPDAYEGAPTTVTAYLSVASKAASIAFLLRIFLGPLAPARATWEPMLAIVAVATMTVGNLAAINQNNLKRLLAYSSISHAGYMLLGLIAGNDTGIKGIAVYVMVYTFMNLGAFLVIIALRRQNIIGEDIDDIAGLMHKSPGYAVLMLIFLLSLAGIPPTAGFLGKYYIFLSLMETKHYTLAVIGTLYVAVAIYYYFRIVRSMFTREEISKEGMATTFGLRHSAGGQRPRSRSASACIRSRFCGWCKHRL